MWQPLWTTTFVQEKGCSGCSGYCAVCCCLFLGTPFLNSETLPPYHPRLPAVEVSNSLSQLPLRFRAGAGSGSTNQMHGRNPLTWRSEVIGGGTRCGEIRLRVRVTAEAAFRKSSAGVPGPGLPRPPCEPRCLCSAWTWHWGNFTGGDPRGGLGHLATTPDPQALCGGSSGRSLIPLHWCWGNLWLLLPVFSGLSGGRHG